MAGLISTLSGTGATAQGGLSGSPTAKQRLPLAFSKKMLERLEKMNPTPFLQFNTEYPIQQNTGDQIIVTLTQALSVSTSPLDAGSQAAQNAAFSTSSITMTLRFYGNDIGWTTLFDLTSADIARETHSRELAMNAKETLTQLVVDDLDGVSVTSAAGAMTFARAVAAAKTLIANKVHGFEELQNHYCGAIGPMAWEDLSTEQSAAYKDHYQYGTGSEVLAEGMLSKPAADIQFFVTNYNKGTTLESEYFWGDGALAHTELRAGVAGADGRPINLPQIASLVGYLIPARAELYDPYGFQHHSVWRAGPVDFAVADSNRVYVCTVT